MVLAQLLTSRWYLSVSEGQYDSHQAITYDHGYVARELIDYLNYRHDDLTFGATESDTTILMRDIEIRHMVDVKNLYTTLRITALLSGIMAFALLYYEYKKDKVLMIETLETMFLIPLMFTIFIGTWVLIDFNRLFTRFHELFFSNDDWLLRSDDVLIQLLPSAFWMVSGIIILFGIILIEASIFIISKRLKTQM
jgi:integral membrane protein (TIGR01906 family)